MLRNSLMTSVIGNASTVWFNHFLLSMAENLSYLLHLHED